MNNLFPALTQSADIRYIPTGRVLTPKKPKVPEREKTPYQKTLDQKLNKTARILTYQNPSEQRKRNIDSIFSDIPLADPSSSLPARKIRKLPEKSFKNFEVQNLVSHLKSSPLDYTNDRLAVILGSKVYTADCVKDKDTGNLLVQNITKVGEKLADSYAERRQANTVKWMPETNNLVMGTHNANGTEIWDMNTNRLVHSMDTGTAQPEYIASSSPSTLFQSFSDSTLRRIDIRMKDGTLAEKIIGQSASPITCLQIGEGNSAQPIAIGTEAGHIVIYDPSKSTSSITKFKVSGPVTSLGWMPGSTRWLASGSGGNNGKMYLWDLAQSTAASAMKYSTDTGESPISIHWSKNGQEMATLHGGNTNCIKLWENTKETYNDIPKSLSLIGTLPSMHPVVRFSALTTDGTCMIVGNQLELDESQLSFWECFEKPLEERSESTFKKLKPTTIR